MTIYKTTIKISLIACIFFLLYLWNSDSGSTQQNVYTGLFTGTFVILGVSIIHYWHERLKFFRNNYSSLVLIFQNLNSARIITKRITEHDAGNKTILNDTAPHVDRMLLDKILVVLKRGVEAKRAINTFEFDAFYKFPKIIDSFQQVNILIQMIDEFHSYMQNINISCLNYEKYCLDYDIKLENYKVCSMKKQCNGYDQCHQNTLDEKKQFYLEMKKRILCQIKEIDIHLKIALIKFEKEIRFFH